MDFFKNKECSSVPNYNTNFVQNVLKLNEQTILSFEDVISLRFYRFYVISLRILNEFRCGFFQTTKKVLLYQNTVRYVYKMTCKSIHKRFFLLVLVSTCFRFFSPEKRKNARMVPVRTKCVCVCGVIDHTSSVCEHRCY